MPDRSDLIYRYNGELPGLLCCVFESRRTGRLPLNIWEEWEPCTSLAPELTIPASREEAAQVWRSLRRLSPTGAHWVEVSFLSGEEGKAMDLHDFVWETFERGQDITGFLGDPVVARVFGLQRQVHNEAHLFLEFLRFREQQGVLCAQIEPKSFVLPLMGGHFAARFPGEAFLIHDITHGAALLHRGGGWRSTPWRSCPWTRSPLPRRSTSSFGSGTTTPSPSGSGTTPNAGWATVPSGSGSTCWRWRGRDGGETPRPGASRRPGP